MRGNDRAGSTYIITPKVQGARVPGCLDVLQIFFFFFTYEFEKLISQPRILEIPRVRGNDRAGSTYIITPKVQRARVSVCDSKKCVTFV